MPTQVRGVSASQKTLDRVVAVSWTEADGASWVAEGMGVDPATLQGVIEALELDATSAPAAGLPAGDVPPGWDLTWQAPGLPVEETRPGQTWWIATVADGCRIETHPASEDEPAVVAYAHPDDQIVTVRGQDALRRGDHLLRWQEPSGVVVHIGCETPPGDLLQLAESLVPVAADDPRIP